MQEKNTKQKIIKVATKLFAEFGYDGTTTRDICKAANINISLISYYFGGKEKLYDEIISEAINTQKSFMKDFEVYETEINSMSYEEKITILKNFLDRFIAHIYYEVSKESLILFLRGQKDIRKTHVSPVDNFLRNLLSSIMNKDPNSEDVVYHLTFLFSQVVFPFLIDNSILHFIGNKNTKCIDIDRIKEQINKYVDLFFSKSQLGLKS